MEINEPKYVFKGDLRNGSFIFQGSEIHTFVVEMSDKNEFLFKVYQSLPRQDFSIRLWISYEERSLPLSWGNSKNNINLIKYPLNIRILFSSDTKEYRKENYYTFLVENRIVYVNFQNLENNLNGYRILISNSDH